MVHILERDEYVDDLIDLLGSAPGLVEEVAFFTTRYLSPMRLEDLRAVSDRLKIVFPRLGEAGYRVGPNHLSTTGHRDENLTASVDPGLRRQVGLDGQACNGALCMADEGVLDYVRKSYELLVATEPDFIWIDDDVRLSGHMPTSGCCVCDQCLADLSRRIGESFTRDGLVAAMDDADFERRSHVRRQLLLRNAEIIRNLMAAIEEEVHGADPAIELGFMTGDRFWEGYDFAGIAEKLRGKTSTSVRWRPGGGFYADATPVELVAKAHEIGRQCAYLPDYVTVVQSEIENFPGHQLQKTHQTNALEVIAYNFAGSKGAALNILGESGSPEEHRPRIEHLHGATGFWDRVGEECEESRLSGVWPAWDRLQVAAGRAGRARTLGADVGDDVSRPYTLIELGIPICYAPEDACATAMAGQVPRALGPDRVRQVLGQGALLDVEAVSVLYEMGLGELTGVSLGNVYHSDTEEVYSDHPLNGPHGGRVRDCRQSCQGPRATATELVPLTQGVEALGRLRSYPGDARGMSATVHTNELGGRVCVLSYYPWTHNKGTDRRRRRGRVCDWLSGGTLPLVVHTVARIVPWVRRREDGTLILGLLNLGCDQYGEVELTIRTSGGSVQRLDQDGSVAALPVRKADGGLDVTLADVEPFSFTVLVVSA